MTGQLNKAPDGQAAGKQRLGSWRRPLEHAVRLMPIFLFAAVVALLARTLYFPFVLWDDDIHLYGNMLMHPPTLASLWRLCREPFFGLYVPVTYAFWWGVAWLALPQQGMEALSAWPFHLVNLLLHATNVILVYRLISCLFHRKSAATAGALLFALHPLMVEAVVWVSGAKDLFCTLFSLLALRLALVDAGHLKGRRLALSSLFFVLALLAKPSAAALPAMLIPLCWIKEKSLCKSSMLTAGFWGFAALPLILFTWRLQRADMGTLLDFSLVERLMLAADAFMFYLGKLLLPFPLLADYGRTPELVLGGPSAPYALAGVLLLALSGAWLLRGSFAPTVLALMVAALALLPSSGLIPFAFQHISTVADRYAYLPMVGIAVAVGSLVERFYHRQRLWRIAALGLFALFAVASWLQCAQFRDTAALFEHVLIYNPRSFSAHNNLGLIALQKGDMEPAVTHLTEALRLYPQSYKTVDNLGVAMQRLGRFADAVPLHQRAMTMEPKYATAYVNLAEAYRKLGRDSVVKDLYEAALRVNPEDFLAHNNYGVFLEDQGLFAAAEALYRAALSLHPAPFLAYYNLGLLYEKQGRAAEAAAFFMAALRVRPEAKEAKDGLSRIKGTTNGVLTPLIH